MRRPDIFLDLILLPIIIISITLGAAFGQDGPNDSEVLNQLILNIYIDDAGRALINGYADDPGSLAFLGSSEYTYENDTKQLYAITSSLTSKSRDNWTASFESDGRYDEYQVMLYLPANAKLRKVDCSSGLDYLVSTDNESVIAEVQGFYITDPAINIQYLLTLVEVPRAESNIVTATGTEYPYKIIALLFLLLAGLGIRIFLQRSELRSSNPAGHFDHHDHIQDRLQSSPKKLNSSGKIEQHIDSSHPSKPLYEDAKGNSEDNSKIPEKPKHLEVDEKHKVEPKMTSEISAVMNTLTDKEQSIVKALLRRGGTMTQTEIRYEIDISKSSLSGILTAMEKRKIITKKENGRTNVIELSEQLLNLQERF